MWNKPYIAFVIVLLILNSSYSIYAQTITSKIIDEETRKPVSYATVQSSDNEGVISNEEGIFSIVIKDKITDTDSIYVSCLGYKTKSIPLNSPVDKIIFIKPQVYDLPSVIVSNKKLTAAVIINKVKENLEKNYGYNYARKKLFYRRSDNDRLSKIDFGSVKSSVEGVNETMIEDLMNKFPRDTYYYTEFLADMYDDNTSTEFKLDIIKALRLRNPKQTASIDDIENTVIDFVMENTKPGSYFEVRSGLVKLKLDEIYVDSFPAYQENREQKRKEYEEKAFLKSKTRDVKKVLTDLIISKDTPIDFLKKSSKYVFTLDKYVVINNNLVYLVYFFPKKEATFKGRLYVNTEDYAILRADVLSANSIYDRKFNMFNIHVNDVKYKSTTIFSKEQGGIYRLSYIKREVTKEYKVNRPLKIIEKNKQVAGRNKQNQVSLDVNLTAYSKIKTELSISSNSRIQKATFDSFVPKSKTKINYTPSYNPAFWNGYNILEPEQAQKDYKTLEDDK